MYFVTWGRKRFCIFNFLKCSTTRCIRSKRTKCFSDVCITFSHVEPAWFATTAATIFCFCKVHQIKRIKCFSDMCIRFSHHVVWFCKVCWTWSPPPSSVFCNVHQNQMLLSNMCIQFSHVCFCKVCLSHYSGGRMWISLNCPCIKDPKHVQHHQGYCLLETLHSISFLNGRWGLRIWGDGHMMHQTVVWKAAVKQPSVGKW